MTDHPHGRSARVNRAASEWTDPDAEAIPFGDGLAPAPTPEHGDPELVVVSLDDFAAVEEQGAAALIGDGDAALLPEGGDAMLYGDGGAGKTTLAVDLAFHLAAGDVWLGIPVPRAVRVLLIENEGPRSLYRAKLRRKAEVWAGSAVDDRIRVLEEPWGRLSLADPCWRDALGAAIEDGEIDVVIGGPVSRLGMDEAGTLQEVRDFMALVGDVRERSGRCVAVVLIHHENKGGKVSGAWEGAGDTLLHVQARGHGRLRLYVQKARWSSTHHATALELVWTEGEGFALAEAEPERPERVWDDIAAYVLAHGGCGSVEVEKNVAGEAGYVRRRRDQMLDEEVLINAGTEHNFRLWHRDDPARPLSVSEDRHASDTRLSPAGERDEGERVSVSPLKGDTPADTPPPDSPGDSGGGDTT
jgi:hypothetical protein